jgi:hypothetical protein
MLPSTSTLSCAQSAATRDRRPRTVSLPRGGSRQPRFGVLRYTCAATSLLLAWNAATAPQPAIAGCNVVPEPSISFRGALGSINRAFFQPGDEVRITLGSADGIPSIKDVSEIRVAVAIKSADLAPSRGSLAPRRVLRERRRECWVKRLFCAAPPHRMHAASIPPLVEAAVADVRLEQSFPAPPVVAFSFPDTDAAGPVIITVARVRDDPPDALPVTTCDGAASVGLLGCIDRLEAAPGVEVTSCSGNLEVLALPPSNEFRALCTKQQGAPNCNGAATQLQFAIDSVGDTFIPVTWGTILHPSPGGPRRRVRGNSSIRAFLDEPNRIIVPNADYLGTSTLGGFGYTPKPVFEPDNTGSPKLRNVLALTGQTDEDDSVLRVCRRAPTAFECASGSHAGEACDPNTGASNCPGACFPFFSICAGGPRDGRPCTRQSDCRPAGTCQAGATCRLQGVDTKKPCHTDAGCPANQECGPGLFEFRYGRATGNLVSIPRAGRPDLMGICDDGPYEGNLCATDADCDGAVVDTTPHCVAFRADAGPFE